MTRLLYILLLIGGIPALTYFYFMFDFRLEVDKIFLTISTFIFSIFTGFFISRQASRFNRVRETVTAFDGKLSSIYRTSGHISKELQVKIGAVVSKHYSRILESGQWNIHFLQKSSTLQDIHTLLEANIVEKDVTKLSNQALGAIIKGLSACQDVRKQMIALYEERVPKEQWILIGFFSVILIMTVSVIPSGGVVFTSLLKAAFVASVFSIILILYKLNNLVYSERLMGEHSAHDVIGIIDGSK